MKKRILYLTMLILPFLIMVMINEFVKSKMKENGFQYKSVTAINSAKANKEKCTWQCHNNTDFCKTYHVKVLKAHFKYTDPIYFGIINSLKSTGNYAWANIIFLVILLPGLMFLLLIKSIKIQLKIREIKQPNE